MNFNVRPAVPSDCEAICELIQELADYENFAEAPKLTAETLRRDGFGKTPVFHCFVAEVGEPDSTDDPVKKCKIAGYCLYYYTYSTWAGKAIYMEDLFVAEDYRNNAVGTALLQTLAEECIKNNCCRLDFAVLNWNERAINFYKSRGGVDVTACEAWHMFRFSRKAIEDLAS